MAAKRERGLGRPGGPVVENSIEEEGEPFPSISEIEPNRAQPRKQFDDEALAELSASISQPRRASAPLLVRPVTGGSYQLVAGERRWRASCMPGLTEVPVVIREMSDKEAAELARIENLQEDQPHGKKAMGYRTLMETYGLTQEKPPNR